MTRCLRELMVALTATVLVFALAVPSVSRPTTALADTSADIQAQLDDANAKLDDIYSKAEAVSEQLNDTKVKLDSTQSQIDQIQAQIEQTQSQIDEMQARIEQKQAELDHAQMVLSERVAANYKAGNASSLDVLLESTSFDDLVSRIYYADKFSEQNAQMIQDVKDIKADLESQKSALDEQKSQLESQNAQLQDQKDQQLSLLSQQRSQQADLDAQSKQAQSYIDNLSSELKQKLAEEEAARQEAARQAAAAAAASAGASGTYYSGGTVGSLTQDQRNTILAAAYSMLGGSYVWAAYDPSGRTFDCSGLTKYCYACAGVGIDHSSSSQSSFCTKSLSAAVPGDVVWRSGHVGIYIGNGQTIEAMSPSQGIRVGTLSSFSSCGPA